ncbi:MAG: sigma-70 family RNA polymerase sigma factor [Pyrinomonadaceae bacterium]
MSGVINQKKTEPNGESETIRNLIGHSDYLFSFAFSRTRDQTAAEDLVQETLLAALESGGGFSHNSSEKTWLTGILKHKIIDYFRRKSRQVALDPEESEEVFFDGAAHRDATPADWKANPESLLERKEFRAVLGKCLADLPENLRSVFVLREIEGLETGEICRLLDISPNNLWVQLHRARLRLHGSIERLWFSDQAETAGFRERKINPARPGKAGLVVNEFQGDFS